MNLSALPLPFHEAAGAISGIAVLRPPAQTRPTMKRRDFLKSSLAAGAVAATAGTIAEAAETPAAAGRELYELRQYHLRQGPMLKRFDEFYRDIALPAWNRAGMATVGVFDVMIGPDQPTKYVLLPFKSWEAMATAREKFEADDAVMKSDFANLPPTDPGYLRKESSLLLAFTGIPKLEIPPQVAEKRSRLFELRTYEAHSRKANRKKVEMFNVGEIEIFRRAGLRPVFFGEGLIGTNLPKSGPGVLPRTSDRSFAAATSTVA